ncbi:MAG: BREX-1 system phosphatase PglZ type B, partial [Lutibacter sp.]|nr:BREX-1 system phosphatase PglZ type B [Lutibacter sp.]
TKDAIKKALPSIFQNNEVLLGKSIIDADFLNNQLFPEIIPSILKWICKGDLFIESMEVGKREIFSNLCKTQYDFEPDHRNIKAIVEKLGTQRNGWNSVWQFYAAAPKKYPEIEDLLRLAKPDDLGSGIFAIPQESWPQVNEEKEEELRKQLEKALKLDPKKASEQINVLENEHYVRRSWVWCELEKSPIAKALYWLKTMAEIATLPFPHASIDEIKEYYTSKGLKADTAMRKAMASVKTEKDKSLLKNLIKLIYQPWLENITNKFQALVEIDSAIFTSQSAIEESESYVLFVDAFRYELANEFCKRLTKLKYKIKLENSWSAIPSLTPTAKPNVSPIAALIATNSEISEFRPQLKTGKDLKTDEFRKALKSVNFNHIVNANSINPNENSWEEIGDIDTKGHEEQSDMVKRIEELFEQVQESLDVAFEKGVKKIKIVTDHGWLLLPGGLPKTEINAGLTETRWGRCALIKEGVSTGFLHLPWRWNPAIFIAYAPGISFFKANEEYAHGGVSIQECLVPVVYIDNPNASTANAKILEIKWVNLKCTISTVDAKEKYSIDVRTKYNDESTSIIESRNKIIADNKIFVMVNDDAEAQAATIVLLDENGRILDKKVTTVGE